MHPLRRAGICKRKPAKASKADRIKTPTSNIGKSTFIGNLPALNKRQTRKQVYRNKIVLKSTFEILQIDRGKTIFVPRVAGYTIIVKSTFVVEIMNRNSDKKVSIALCTYNGERFLQEQLESIAVQTVVPFELVICDDVSSDSTREILEKFATNANFPVRLYFNSENLGFVKNFEKAISLCSGEIIFLSDQDDVWRADKLEVMQKYFSDPKVGMAFSNAAIIDADGVRTGEFLWDAAYFTPKLRQLFLRGDAYQALYQKPIVSGCTMAFDRKWWKNISPLPKDIPAIHDAWIALMTSLYSEVIAIDEPLIEYRLHPQQSASLYRRDIPVHELVAKTHTGEKKQQYQKHLIQLQVIRERIQQEAEFIAPEKRDYLLKLMIEHEQHLHTRIDIPQNILARYGVVLKELRTGRYGRFSNGIKSAVADLLKRPT